MGFRGGFKLGKGSRFSFGPRSASFSVGGVRIGTRSSSVKVGGNTFTLGGGSRGSRAYSGAGNTVSMDVKIGIEDDGKITFKDAAGNPLPEHLVRKVKREYKQQILELHDRAHKKATDKNEQIINIHKNLFFNKEYEEWEAELEPRKYLKKDFNESSLKAIPPDLKEVEKEVTGKKAAGFSLFFFFIMGLFFVTYNELFVTNCMTIMLLSFVALIVSTYIIKVGMAKNVDEEYQKLLNDFKEKKEEHLRLMELQKKEHDRNELVEEGKFDKDEAVRIEKLKQLLIGDLETISEELGNSLSNVSFPLETDTDFIIGSSRKIMLDVNLPGIDDVFSKKSRILASGKVSLKEKTKKELSEDYARAVHGIVLSLASLVFSSIPSCFDVIVSGYTQRIDRSTGLEQNEYIISAMFNRIKLYEIKIPKADPILVYDNFENRRDMTATYNMKKIEPYSPEEMFE